MYALNLADDGRILSACIVLGWQEGDDIPESYNGMPVVETLPDGDVADYLYMNNTFVYDPILTPDQPDPNRPTPEDRITAVEEALTAIEEGIASV